MAEWKVKKGNYSVQEIQCLDKDGVALTNLASATEIKFQVKKTKTSTAAIEKTVGSGIEVNQPSTGYIRVTLLITDTDLLPDTYYMGLQITWAGGQVYECVLKISDVETDSFVIEQDIVNV